MKIPKILLFLIPAAVFMALLALLVSLLSPNRPESASTEIRDVFTIPLLNPTPTPTPAHPLDTLILEISNFNPTDPTLTAPVFDREINLPLK